MGKQFGPDAVRQEVAGYTLSRFFSSNVRIAIIVSAALIALPKLGIQVTPFLAAVGALGLGAGLAIQFELRACSA
jgi:small conductance mechanosensitive channel